MSQLPLPSISMGRNPVHSPASIRAAIAVETSLMRPFKKTSSGANPIQRSSGSLPFVAYYDKVGYSSLLDASFTRSQA